jgi:cytochrome c2
MIWKSGVAAIVLAAAAVSTAAQAQDVTVNGLTGDPEAGGEVYATECRGCHAVSIAPTLRGVIGRPIASVTAFVGYSAALKVKSADSWSEANLDVFLADPQAFAPATLMVKAVPDAQQRADVIAYIASLPPPRN